MPAWRRVGEELEIAVRVTPRGGRDSLTAGTQEHLAARLAAAPVDGKANAALIALVAEAFDVSRRAVTLVAGDTSRLKRLRITGDAGVLAETAARLYEAGP